MNAVWNHIAKSIFDRPDVENVSLEELDYLVEEYPYFPVIHFLRTRKVLADRLPEAISSASRTALYFPNPHWLHYQLEGIVADIPQEVPLAEILTTPSQAEELSTVIPDEQPLTAAEVIQEETELKFDDKRIYAAEAMPIQVDETAMEAFPGDDVAETITDDESNATSLPLIPEETTDRETVDMENFHTELQDAAIEEVNEENDPQPAPDQERWDAAVEVKTEDIRPTEPTQEEPAIIEPLFEETVTTDSVIEQTDVIGAAFEEVDTTEPVGQQTGANQLESEDHESTTPGEQIDVIEPIAEYADQTEPIQEESAPSDPVLAESAENEAIQKESFVADTITEEKTMVQPVAEAHATIEQESEEDLEVPFEPLYTIDYFASQGIKLRLEEEQQNDQLSVKLRSFTEWLKAMKKIHPEKLDHKMGQEEENNIRVYAETSNEPREVYTEALAEVYLQQGLRQKALMVLEKLSLLDPSKSAYFAARIREIKEN